MRRGRWPTWAHSAGAAISWAASAWSHSYDGIVDIELKRQRCIWLAFLLLPCNRLAISLEEPAAFVSTVAPQLYQADFVPD